eukprot:6989579-Pyramimonas_sp.AAC.1
MGEKLASPLSGDCAKASQERHSLETARGWCAASRTQRLATQRVPSDILGASASSAPWGPVD